jgi:hypothetical protein
VPLDTTSLISSPSFTSMCPQRPHCRASPPMIVPVRCRPVSESRPTRTTHGENHRDSTSLPTPSWRGAAPHSVCASPLRRPLCSPRPLVYGGPVKPHYAPDPQSYEPGHKIIHSRIICIFNKSPKVYTQALSFLLNSKLALVSFYI